MVEVAVLAKRFDRAKSRLDLPSRQSRSLLAQAMLLDTLAVVAPVADRVAVVSSQPLLASLLADELPDGLGDRVAVINDPGALNAAVRTADAWFVTGEQAGSPGSARPNSSADLRIAMVADLPSLTTEEFRAVVAEARRHRRSFVPDASGRGTTAVCATVGPLWSRFGPRSAFHHRTAGLGELVGPWPGARRDVDVVADLAAAAQLGLGPRTAALTGHHTTAGPAPEREPCCR